MDDYDKKSPVRRFIRAIAQDGSLEAYRERNFRLKRLKRAFGTEVWKHTRGKSSALNTENKSSRRKLVTAADSPHKVLF